MALLLALLLLGAGAWRVSGWLNSDAFSTEMEEVLSNLVRRETAIEGTVDLMYYPWLGVAVEDVRVKNLPQFEGDLASFGRLMFRVRLLPLLQGEVEVDTVEADHVDLLMIRNAESVGNWEHIAPEQGQDVVDAAGDRFFDFRLVSIRGVTVRDADVVVEDRVSGREFQVEDLRIKTGKYIPGGMLAYDVSGSFGFEDTNVEATIKGKVDTSLGGGKAHTELLRDSVVDLVASDGILPPGESARMTFALGMDPAAESLVISRLEFSVFDMRMSGSLNVTKPLESPSYSGRVFLHTFSPAKLLTKLAPDFDLSRTDGLRRMSLKANIEGNSENVAFNGLDAELDGMKFSGNAKHLFSDASTTFSLQAGDLDLDVYLPLFLTGEPWKWSDFGLAFFRSLNASGTLKADSLRIKGRDFSSLKGTLKASDGRVQVLTAGAFASGQLDASLDAVVGTNEVTGNPTLSLQLHAHGDDLDVDALHDFKTLDPEGKISAKAHVTLSHRDCPPAARSILGLRGMQTEVSTSWSAMTLRASEGEPMEFGPMSVDCSLKPKRADGAEFPYEMSLRVRGGLDSPRLEGDARFAGPVRFGQELEYLVLQNVSASTRLGGFFMPGKKRGTLKGRFDWDSREDRIGVRSFEAKALGATVKLDGSVQRPFDEKRTAQGSFDIRDFNLKRTLELYGIELIRFEKPTALTSARLAGDFTINGLRAKLTQLDGVFDGATVAGTIVVPSILENGFEVALKGGDVDVDQYFAHEREIDPRDYRNRELPEDEPTVMPLDSLKHINVRGRVVADSVKFCDALIAPAEVDIDSWDGNIRIKRASGGFYGGRLNGSWAARVGDHEVATHVNVVLKNFEGARFMRDMAGKSYVAGQSWLEADLSGHGLTDEQILRTLKGTLATNIRDGSYKFSGWDSEKRENARTSFNNGKILLDVNKGVFSTRTFLVQSPVMTADGDGWFDLAEDRIELAIKATFVAVPGITVKLEGKLSDPKVSMPPETMLTDTVRNILGLPKKSFKFLRDLFFF